MRTIEVTTKDQISLVFPKVTRDLIRVGRLLDGGYVISEKTFRKVDLILSLGIGDDWSFETEAYRLLPEVKVVGSDYTVTKEILKNFLLKEIIKLFFGKSSFKKVFEQYKFNQKYNAFYGKKAINLGKRISNKDEGVDITLESILKNYKKYKNIFLKMDVEGGEYYTIKSIIRNRLNIPFLSIEFHNCATLSHSFFSYLKDLKEYYDIIHTHIINEVEYIENNPEVYEISFQRKDMSLTNNNIEERLVNFLPTQLDSINNKDKLEYAFHFKEI